MPQQPDETVEVLQDLWASTGQSRDDLDEDCGPQSTCKNMKHVSFDGMAEPGTDLRDAWRELLEREGKRSAAAGSVRDLVLGPLPNN
jgi:hypothetical protein